MKSAIILHGTGGSPDSNWFRWLKAELEAKGLQVWLPALPNPDLPSLKANTNFLLANCPFPINANTLVVGHSSGAILALILAQSNSVSLGGIVAVSVFHDNSLGWEKNAKLFDVDFDWPAIKAKSGKLLFIHSDTDPYVPLDQAKYVADNCEAEMVVLPGQGHFNLEQSPEYKQFPRLLELIGKKVISNMNDNSQHSRQSELAKKLLKIVRHAAYATINEDGTPHNSPLMLIYNENLTKLYVGSYSESLHCKNFARTGRAFVVLFDSFTKGQGGVYITGTNAHECEGDELVEALRVHNTFRAKHNSQPIDIGYYQAPKPSQRMYSIDIAKIEVYSAVRDENGLMVSEARVPVEAKELLEAKA